MNSNGSWVPAETPHAVIWDGPAPDLEKLAQHPDVVAAVARIQKFERELLATFADRPIIVVDSSR